MLFGFFEPGIFDTLKTELKDMKISKLIQQLRMGATQLSQKETQLSITRHPISIAFRTDRSLITSLQVSLQIFSSLLQIRRTLLNATPCTPTDS